MAQQSANSLKPVRVPLVGTFQNRSGSFDKDQRFINCFPETRANDATETKRIYLYQRPGLVSYSSVTAGEGRGVMYWNSKVYSVVGNKLYSNTTAIQTLTTSTGQCSFEVGTTPDDDVLVLADGTFVYVISKTDVVTQVPLTLSAWVASTAYVVGNRIIPTVANGFYYECITAGTTSTGEPTWPTDIGSTVTNGTSEWMCAGISGAASYWIPNHIYSFGARIVQTVGGNDYLFECTTYGISGASQPNWAAVEGQYTTDNTVIWVCIGVNRDDAPPKYHQPSLAFLDGYLFLVLKKADGSGTADIYNSDVDNPYSWNPTNYITAEQFPDNVSALTRQNNMLVAFGENTTEFFYDGGNATGSPLSRNASYTLQAGIAAPNAIYSQERFCLFIGQSQSGGRAVWMLDGFAPKKVSDEYMERILDAEGTSIVNATGYGVRSNGHLFYVINLTNYTFVYDLEERLWHAWTGVNCVAATDNLTGKAILQHKTNGKLYYLDPTVGTDDGTAISTEIYTAKFDFGTMNLKSMQSMHFVSDMVGTDKTLQYRWSDDDYNTWTDWKTLNFYPRSYVSALGSFRRRAFHFKFNGGVPARFEAVEFDIRLWKA